MRISWLLRNWFGTSDTADGQGLETTFEHAWPLPAWLTLLAVALVAAIVLATYHYEHRGRKPIRAVMTALRLAVFAMALFMLYGWVQHQHRTELPELIIVVDASQSMSFEDAYQNSRVRKAIDRLAGDVDGGTSRLALARLLVGDDQQRGWLSHGCSPITKSNCFGLAPSVRRLDDHAAGIDVHRSRMTKRAGWARGCWRF